MADRTRMLRATVLAAPLGALALTAQAAVTSSAMQQVSRLGEAVEFAGSGVSQRGEGPYSVLAQAETKDADVPSSPHQEEVLRGQQSGEQPGSPQLPTEQPQTGAQDVPSSPHQEQVLRGEQDGEQQGSQQLSTEQPQTGAQGSDMPSSPHQEQVLPGEQPGEQD